ncbi:MAG: sensor domain-containing diguanylate cyclase [Thiotrichales bacterium]|nr:sensor domain-containing diguanylate cyclase [Thiotrichales bacterium]
MQSHIKLSLDQIPCAYLATNVENKITAVNETLCNWLNKSDQELIGQPIITLLTVPSRMLFLGTILPHIQTNHYTEENYLSLKLSSQETLPIMLNARRIEHNGKDYFSYALMKMNRRHLIEQQLIQERHRAESAIEEKEAINVKLQIAQNELLQKQHALEAANAELKSLSSIDTLTGLPNRRVYEQELNKQFELFERYQYPFCLILFDIDFFKKVNDRHGHDVGDTVLKTLAKTLLQHLRKIDLLSRVGGEEFCILLPHTQLENAKIVAERYRATIEKIPFEFGTVTASFGVTEVRPNETPSKLYKRADQALYIAKEQGRNQVVSQ